MSHKLLAPLLVALAAGGCDALLVEPAGAPARVEVVLGVEASRAIMLGDAQDAFDAADSARVVLVRAAGFDPSNDPFQTTTGRLADQTFPIPAGDTLRLSIELADSVITAPTEVVFGLLLKSAGDPLFVFLDSVEVRPNETARALVPLLLPVPDRLELVAPRDSMLLLLDSVTVGAVALFATGDTIPSDLFFPDFSTPDGGVLTVYDRGSYAVAYPVAGGSGRVVARTPGYVVAEAVDTLVLRVIAPAGQDTAQLRDLVVGGGFACGRTFAGDELFCWGSNAMATFGDGTNTSSTTPVLAAGGMGVQDYSAGLNHVCAIRTGGSLSCWGSNSAGQVGATPAGGIAVHPVNLPGTWSKVSAGSETSCAIDTGSLLFCWGSNAAGQFGNGVTGGTNPVPTQVGTEQWSRVDVSHDRVCGTTLAGVEKCWGKNGFGGLGTGNTGDSPAPLPIAGGPWSDLTIGGDHACAMKIGGTPQMYCWGRNHTGQLGIGPPDPNPHPTPEPITFTGSPFIIDAGSYHSCLIRFSDRGFSCWGNNSDGQTGSGAPPARWATIHASIFSLNTCGIREDNRAFCWGDGAFGQLGNGATEDAPHPVPVRAPSNPVTHRSRGSR